LDFFLKKEKEKIKEKEIFEKRATVDSI